MTKDYITLFRVILYDRPTPAEFADVNDAVIEDWKADTTPYERIRHVIADTYQPVSAAAVADDAQTAPKTARKHLNTLADEGFVETEPGKQGGTLYCRSSVSLVVEQAADILEHVSTDELATRIQEMRKQFTEYQVEFGVDSPEELAVDQTNQALTEEGSSPDETDPETINEWKALRRNLAFTNAALSIANAEEYVDGDHRASDEASSPEQWLSRAN